MIDQRSWLKPLLYIVGSSIDKIILNSWIDSICLPLSVFTININQTFINIERDCSYYGYMIYY